MTRGYRRANSFANIQWVVPCLAFRIPNEDVRPFGIQPFLYTEIWSFISLCNARFLGLAICPECSSSTITPLSAAGSGCCWKHIPDGSVALRRTAGKKRFVRAGGGGWGVCLLVVDFCRLGHNSR